MFLHHYFVVNFFGVGMKKIPYVGGYFSTMFGFAWRLIECDFGHKENNSPFFRLSQMTLIFMLDLDKENTWETHQILLLQNKSSSL